MNRYHTGMAAMLVNWSAVQCVMLDMDGTVLDLAFDDYFWTSLLPQRYAALHGTSIAQAQHALEPIFAAEHGTLNWYSLDFWSDRTGLDMAALHVEIRDRIAVLPGSRAFLDAVRASGRALWLVTNADAHGWQLKMLETGLGICFDRIVSAHEFGAAKEQPAFWQRLAAAHPFDAARSLLVDDNLGSLSAARAYGVQQVMAVRRPNSKRPPRDVEDFPAVDGLADLLPLPV
ncbi:MAG TPA: HAD-IA family hydrolase [Nevskiaceae bacterium]|nr:HAD-IA family hydrolase [Nevskiaceae bacterium]